MCACGAVGKGRIFMVDGGDDSGFVYIGIRITNNKQGTTMKCERKNWLDFVIIMFYRCCYI